MDQEQVIDKFVVNGTNTLRTILKILENLSSDGLHNWLERQDTPTTGQNKLHRLLNATDPVTSQFLRQEVDLKKSNIILKNKVSRLHLRKWSSARISFSK